MNERSEDLKSFYSLLDELEMICGGRRRLQFSDRTSGWPSRGVYFFFEDGELREDGICSRVVRVGTHGLRPSRSTLWGRLAQHRGTAGGEMPGGGNHRGSVFRLHVGTALLNSGDWPVTIRETWAKGSNASRSVRKSEYPLEEAVSRRIRAMPLLWVDVPDEPSVESDRGIIERGAIGLLSNLGRSPIDASSATWLGRSSNRERISGSGLWNVNHVDETPGSNWLHVLATWMGRQARS
jgi:hypothetical protein